MILVLPYSLGSTGDNMVGGKRGMHENEPVRCVIIGAEIPDVHNS